MRTMQSTGTRVPVLMPVPWSDEASLLERSPHPVHGLYVEHGIHRVAAELDGSSLLQDELLVGDYRLHAEQKVPFRYLVGAEYGKFAGSRVEQDVECGRTACIDRHVGGRVDDDGEQQSGVDVQRYVEVQVDLLLALGPFRHGAFVQLFFQAPARSPAQRSPAGGFRIQSSRLPTCWICWTAADRKPTPVAW